MVLVADSSWSTLYVVLLQHVLEGPSYEFAALIDSTR
jgi:hypothetical protein